MTGINELYIDISWPISPAITAYKDRSVVCMSSTKEFAQDAVRESLLTIGSHTGTHIDAPAHFLADGKTTEAIPLSATIGPCRVIDMTHCSQCITQRDLVAVADQLTKDTIVLFKTRNSEHGTTDPFDANFIYVDQGAAHYLVEQKIKAVGIDYLGIERNQKGHETHITLLQADIIIIEGLRLGQVKPGNYFLYCLPLAVTGLDGAPARAMLVQQ